MDWSIRLMRGTSGGIIRKGYWTIGFHEVLWNSSETERLVDQPFKLDSPHNAWSENFALFPLHVLLIGYKWFEIICNLDLRGPVKVETRRFFWTPETTRYSLPRSSRKQTNVIIIIIIIIIIKKLKVSHNFSWTEQTTPSFR
jgi:hypothetical protein